MTDWLVALGCIFGVNLLPAFGPPTWALLVFFRVSSGLPAVPLVLLGAIAAASVAKDSLGDVLGDAIGSPLGIALQAIFLAGLVLLVRVDWVSLARRRALRQGHPRPR